MTSPDRNHLYMELPGFPHSHITSWLPDDAKIFSGFPSMPEYISRFDMLLAEDAAWLVKKTETPLAKDEELPHCKEAGQCPVIDSVGRGLCPGLNLQVDVEDRCLEQVQTLVLEEVLKDIDTACKLLNITPGGQFPFEMMRCSPDQWFLFQASQIWKKGLEERVGPSARPKDCFEY